MLRALYSGFKTLSKPVSSTVHFPLSSLILTHLKKWTSSDRLMQLDTVLWLEHHIQLLEKHRFSLLEERILNLQIEILSLLIEVRLYEQSHRTPQVTRSILNTGYDSLLSNQLDSIHQRMDTLISTWLASLLSDANRVNPLQAAKKLIEKRSNDSFEKRTYLKESPSEIHPFKRPLTPGKKKGAIGLRKFVHCKV